MRSLLFILILFCSIHTIADSVQIDSLKRELSQATEDSSLIKLYNKIGVDYTIINKDSAFSYINKAYKLSRKTNYKKGEAQSLSNFGEYHLYQGRYDSSRVYLNQALGIQSNINDNKGQAMSFNVIGETYRLEGNYEQAVQNYVKALKLIGDQNSHMIATIKTNLGLVYIQMQQYEDAAKNFNTAISIFKREGSHQLVANCYNNLAMVEFYGGDYDKAIEWLKEAVRIYEEQNNVNGQATGYSNIGSTLLELGRLKEAESYLLKGLKKYKELGNESMINTQTINLGYLYIKTNEFVKSEKYLLDGLDKAVKNSNQELKKYCYSYLSDLYEAKKDFKKANTYLKKYVSIKDSILNESNQKQITSLEKKYDLEKKEKSIIELEKAKAEKELALLEKKNEQRILIGAAIGLLFILVIIIIIWAQKHRANKRTIELNNEKINSLLKDSEIQYVNAVIEGQEKERKRIAQDLHDRIGSMLSTAKLHFSSEKHEDLKKAEKILDESIDEVRKTSHNLSSSVLVKFGLIPSVKSFVDSIPKEHLNISFITHDIDDRLDAKIEQTLYRTVQELLSNIIKHAKAKKVTLQLIKNDDEIVLIVEDDGLGFDTSRKYEGIGLKNIKSRIDAVQGTLDIDSQKDKGTTVIVKIPLKND